MKELFLIIAYYSLILSYPYFKKGMQELILDLIKLIFIPIGHIWRSILYLKKKTLKKLN